MTETSEDMLIITDESVIEFYKSNPNLDFTEMNLLLVNILKQLSTNLNDSLMDNINTKILKSLTNLSQDVSLLKQNDNKMELLFATQTREIIKEYIDSIKSSILNQQSSTTEVISKDIERNNDLLIGKTQLIISELLPKHINSIPTCITSSISDLKTFLSQDINSLKQQQTDNSIETRLQTIMNNIQQSVSNQLQYSEINTANSIAKIGEKITEQQVTQNALQTDLNAFLNKYRNVSSVKGAVSENELYFLLQKVFPTDEIIDTHAETACCDFRVNRLNREKPSILFENKDYELTVKTEEIKKFERDLQLQKTHGIFISQSSNITFKHNFQIDIINGLIHVYLTNNNYNVEFVQTAVFIIDSLSSKLSYLIDLQEQRSETFLFTSEDLNSLLKLHTEFTSEKQEIIEHIKSSSKKTIEMIEKLHIAAIQDILVKNRKLETGNNELKCKTCNVFVGKNKASLAAHTKACKPIKTPIGTTVPSSSAVEASVTPSPAVAANVAPVGNVSITLDKYFSTKT